MAVFPTEDVPTTTTLTLCTAMAGEVVPRGILSAKYMKVLELILAISPRTITFEPVREKTNNLGFDQV